MRLENSLLRIHFFLYDTHRRFTTNSFYYRMHYVISRSIFFVYSNPIIKKNPGKSFVGFSKSALPGSTSFFRKYVDFSFLGLSKDWLLPIYNCWIPDVSIEKEMSFTECTLSKNVTLGKREKKVTYFKHNSRLINFNEIYSRRNIFFSTEYFFDFDPWSSPKLDSAYGLLNPVFTGFKHRNFALGHFSKSSHKLLLGDYAVIFGRYPNNFWHFVCEYLPKLRNVRAGQIVLIPRNLRPDFLSFLLGLLENLSLKYLIIPKGAVKFRNLVFIEPAVFSVRNQVFSIDVESIIWLRTKLLEINRMAPTFLSKNDGEVYFLLRKSPRRVIRDKELVRMAKMNGYLLVDPGELSLKQQIEIFQGAKAIIGYPGANWANLIFAHQDLIIYNIVSESASSGTLHQLVSEVSNCVFLNVCFDKKDFFLSAEISYKSLDESGFFISNDQAREIIEFIDNHLEN